MKKSWIFSLFALITLASLFFTGCKDVGLGEEVDLEAPVIKISTINSNATELKDFSGGVYCHKNIEVVGTASDNKGVKSVYAEIKWAGEDAYTHIGDAVLGSGGDWTCALTLQNEGVAFVRFVVTDAVGNESAKSSKVIALFIDETAPVMNGWYIDRGVDGIQYSLKEKEELEALNFSEVTNKDAAQNVAFSINAVANDEMGISKVSLLICDEEGNRVCEVENSSESHYAPKFEITHEALVAGKPALNSGKHYLQVYYNAEDIVAVPDSNKAVDVAVDGGWFVWWPESDLPKITNSQVKDDNGLEYINLSVSSVLSLDVFDDDKLDEVYCAFLTESEYASFGTPNWQAIAQNPQLLKNAISSDGQETRYKYFKATNGEREKTLTLSAASKAQTMRILAIAWDGTEAKKLVTKEITAYISDLSSPLLIISSPKNNSVPAVTMATDNSKATVVIQGQTLDQTGCEFLEIVWVSAEIDESQKVLKAKEWLDSISTKSAHQALAPSLGDSSKMTKKDGMILWSVALSDPQSSTESYIKQTFSFTIDILNDFINSNNENEKAKEKFFVAKLSRADDKSIYSEYKLAADVDAPSIVPINPANDMQIVESSSDFVLEFKAVKSSGLAIDKSKYKIEKIESDGASVVNGSYDGATGTYKASISASDLANMELDGIKPKYVFTAEDLFGNKTSASYTLVISSLPFLKSVSSGNSGTVKFGETILINANFNGTVLVTDGALPRLKLKGISNSKNSITTNDIVYAQYQGGSGSTSLIFKYVIQDGDVSDQLLVFNETGIGPIDINSTGSLSSDKVHLDTLDEDNNLQATKTIKIDGVLPVVTGISVTTDGTQNSIDNITYLREGKNLSVKVTADDFLYVQGNPRFVVNVLNEEIELPYEKTSGKILTFSKKIDSSDINGTITYNPSTCIKDKQTIVDSSGNSIVLQTSTTPVNPKIVIDTVAPQTPTVTITSDYQILGTKYYSEGDVKFSITGESATTAEYSTDGGSTWKAYTSAEYDKISSSGSYILTARLKDYAGNISDYAPSKEIEVNGDFPKFSLECLNPDGNYKAGTVLRFKLTFDSKVKVQANAPAKIKITAVDSKMSVGTEGLGFAYAYLSSSAAQTGVTYVLFEYVVQDPDEFSPKIEVNAVDLTGIKDLYNNPQQSSDTLSSAYIRDKIVCDGIAPKVQSMTPKDETASASNIFKNGNIITLVFTEEVQKSSGNISLRQTSGWAIPPVLTAEDFSTISTAISSSDKEILSMQENGKDMEDSENVLQNTIAYPNDTYHGTGRFVGPYKKSTQGLTLSSGEYKPDLSTKYVLDFDIDIWETDQAHPIGKTFTPGAVTLATYQSRNNNQSQTGLIQGQVKTPSTTRTASQIRSVLEKAHYHERVLDVTSSNIVIGADKKTVTITFPAGLCDKTAALPDGREWELVIEKGAFMDMTGNEFGANSSGVIEKFDSIQSAGVQTSTSATWARLRSSITDGSNPVVLIKTAGNEYFYSDNVATPVVRVDRYSYALGIRQVDSSGSLTQPIYTDAVVPTGYVRVRIDCETKEAAVKYSRRTTSNSRPNDGTPYYYNNDNATNSYSYYSQTANLTSAVLSGITPSTAYTSVFAGGNGDYTKSCKEYVIASATKTGFTNSQKGIEGIFQTVIRFANPTTSSGASEATQGTGGTDWSIRGTTGFAGEPYISPFPLRDSQNGSPYLKRCYRERANITTSLDYYWLSYEILVETSVSGYGWGPNQRKYDWARNWGIIYCGEFTRCTGMVNWIN